MVTTAVLPDDLIRLSRKARIAGLMGPSTDLGSPALSMKPMRVTPNRHELCAEPRPTIH